MSKHGTIKLNGREEVVEWSVDDLLVGLPKDSSKSPIKKYFDATDTLKVKILATGEGDAELYGLLVIGVISSLEFYVRSILAETYLLCPQAQRHAEMMVAPLGSAPFHDGTGHPHLLSAFDHESLADAKKIRNYCEKYLGLEIKKDHSVEVVLKDFDRLCEVRHCLVHASGYVGLKASNGLQLQGRVPKRIRLDRQKVFDVLKVAHNVVRALNRCLAEKIADRWVDSGVLVGNWSKDKMIFERFFLVFKMDEEDDYGGVAYRAYGPYRRAILARKGLG